MARRAFVALVASTGVLVTVVGAGVALDAHSTHEIARASGAIAPSSPTEGWLLSPGAVALLLASAFVLIKGRRS